MSVNAILNTASTGIMVQRAAIEVTGENIANVNTAGYSRQRVVLETAPVYDTAGFKLGSGVNVALIQRMYDAAVNRQLADGNSTLGNNQSRLQLLQQIEPYFNEVSSDSLGAAMQSFFDSWQSLSLNASGVAERQAVLSRANVLIDTFHQTNSSIKAVQSVANGSLVGITADITDKARNIADLNAQIKIMEFGGVNANELRDKRDFLIQELSGRVGVTYAEQTDGTINITLAGGQALVTGDHYATMYANPVATSNSNLPNPINNIMLTAVGKPPAATNPLTDANITATVGGSNNSKGEIGAVLVMRDTVIPSYLQKLDELAFNFATKVNDQHILGFNLNNAHVNFFTPAATSAGYSSAAGISLNIATTNEIAAAGASILTGGAGDNRNAVLIAQIRSAQISFSGGVATTLSSYYNALSSGVGIDVQAASNTATQSESFMKQLGNLRESVSGVSLDEELTNLIKYQKAFEGSARMVNVATEMMDTILGMVR